MARHCDMVVIGRDIGGCTARPPPKLPPPSSLGWHHEISFGGNSSLEDSVSSGQSQRPASVAAAFDRKTVRGDQLRQFGRRPVMSSARKSCTGPQIDIKVKSLSTCIGKRFYLFWDNYKVYRDYRGSEGATRPATRPSARKVINRSKL